MSCRQFFSTTSESALNKQVTSELEAAHAYRGLAAYYARDDVQLMGVSKYFAAQSEEETGHAQKFIDYINLRGGRVTLEPVGTVDISKVVTALDGFEFALELERQVNAKLMHLVEVAETEHDEHFHHLVEDGFLDEQVESIREFAGYVSTLKRMNNDATGVYLFDRDLSK